MTSCQISLGTVKFDYSKVPLAEDPKTTEFGLVDLLSDRIVSLVKYLDGKMAKYSVPTCSAGSYVQLVHKRTKTKVVATAKLERGKDLNADCNRFSSELLAVEKQSVAAQAKLVEIETTVQNLEKQTDVGLPASVERCLSGYVNWEIQTTK
ncbi:hypothetical protein AXG93_412s1400 [Marchantia polymorpha subsp. ruderalis]|uniref:Uncharacterized protein n=1 Tax=Marchantia polymorpha subsp. ruderalis TaxID=1480154 RepID=A0A176VMZ7_MARPO|nr:hypothetical protein AXG93_412s1400 [Marchantia polymorpha subsp. ruderalis]